MTGADMYPSIALNDKHFAVGRVGHKKNLQFHDDLHKNTA